MNESPADSLPKSRNAAPIRNRVSLASDAAFGPEVATARSVAPDMINIARLPANVQPNVNKTIKLTNQKLTMDDPYESWQKLTMNPPHGFWRIEPASDKNGIANVFIFGPIEINPRPTSMFAQGLDALPEGIKRLNIHINSQGGDMFVAHAIYSTLWDYSARKVVYLDEFVAGAATVIAMISCSVHLPAYATLQRSARTRSL